MFVGKQYLKARRRRVDKMTIEIAHRNQEVKNCEDTKIKEVDK